MRGGKREREESTGLYGSKAEAEVRIWSKSSLALAICLESAKVTCCHVNILKIKSEETI